MAKENTTKNRIIEIFDDENIYEEVREQIKESIINEIYYSSFKDTHFYKEHKVLDQVVDIFIDDILEDKYFQEDLEKLNKLLKLDYTPREMYLYRRDHSGNKPYIDLNILRKVEMEERLTPEEEEIYNDYKQKESEQCRNTQLALNDINGYILNDEEKDRLNRYLEGLITKEEALEMLKKENVPKIKRLREDMKLKYFKKLLPNMRERLSSISDPFDLNRYRRGYRIFKVNGNTELISIDEPNNSKSRYDFDVTSEYIIIDRKSEWIEDEDGHYKEHFCSNLAIYIPPRENGYPEGTHLSDLIYKKKEKEWYNMFKGLYLRAKSEGAKDTDIKAIMDFILNGKKENEITD